MMSAARSESGKAKMRFWSVALALMASTLSFCSANAEVLQSSEQDRPLVSVKLVHEQADRPTVSLKVPSNYIDPSDTGNCVGSRGEQRLHIEDKKLKLAFANPGGQGWCGDRRRHWSPKDTSDKGFRKQISLVELSVNGNPNWDERNTLSFTHARRQSEKWYDLLYFKGVTQDYFLGDPSDYFNSISCSKSLRPLFYCNYTIKLSDVLIARARFADFRSHGGRAFANERSRLIRDTVCRFTSCEPVAKPVAYRGDQRQRVCLDGDVPSIEAKIAFSRYVMRNVAEEKADAAWSARTGHMSWRVRVPKTTFLQPLRDRPDAVRNFFLSMLYPEKVLSEPVRNSIYWKIGANLPSESASSTTCSNYAEISAEEVYDRALQIEFFLPTHPGLHLPNKRPDGCFEDRVDRTVTRMPELDFQEFKACRYSSSILGYDYNETLLLIGPDEDFPVLSCAIAREDTGGCSMKLVRDGWPVRVGFRSDRKAEWKAIKASAFAFLDGITISRDDITELVKP